MTQPPGSIADSALPSSTAAETLRARVRELQLPKTSENRSQGKTWIWLLVLFLITTNVVLAWWIWLLSQAPPAETDAATTETTSSAVASSQNKTGSATAATNAAANSGAIVLEYKGYVIPAHQILVSPKVSGMIIELHVEEGARKTTGDILAVLESTEYQSDYDNKLATIELMQQRFDELHSGNRPEEILQARADLAEAQEQLEEYRSTYARQEKLWKEKATTELTMIQAEQKYLAQQKRVERLQQGKILMEAGPRKEKIAAAAAELQQAKADFAKAKWRLDNCTIRAPITGTILKKNAEEGNIVNPVAFNGSFSVCDMADLSDLEVELSVQERDVSHVFKDQRCIVRPEAFQDRVYPAYVSRLMPIADRAKGAVPVRIKLKVPSEEEGVYLKPEMSATVSFYSDSVTPAEPPPP